MPSCPITRRKRPTVDSYPPGKRTPMGQHHPKGPRPLSRGPSPSTVFFETEPARQASHGKCDFTLAIKDVKFPCHRIVLTGASRYFRTMLTQFEEKSRDEVELKDIVEPGPMATCLLFIYGQMGKQRHWINGDNVHDLLLVANYLQVEDLQAVCSKYIQDRVDRKNCIPLYLHSLVIGPYELQCVLEDFILQHFELVVGKNGRQLWQLSKEQLCKLLASDKLLVTSEAIVYRAVMLWVSASPRERSTYLPGLLEHVHFPLMSKDEVEQYMQNSQVKKNRNLVNKLQEAKNYLDKNTNEKIDYWTTKPKPARWPKIFVVMRMYWKNLPMEYYDFRTKSWHVLCDVQNWRSCTSLVSHATSVYLLGGEESDPESPTGSRTVNRVTRYDCESRKWASAPSMQLARRWAGSIVVGNKIYVIGGIGGKGGTYEKRLDSMEVLDLENVETKGDRKSDKNKSGPKWKMLTPMSTPRSSHTVEVLEGMIYVVGGGDGREWLCSAEAFNPRTQKWSPIASLNIKRWKCGLVSQGGALYAIGGMDSPKAGFWGAPLKSVEKYCPIQNKWIEVASMNEARFGCAVVAYQGKVYATGGFGVGKAILSSQECYDPDTDKWTKVTQMKKMCGFVGGTLVDRPIHFEQE